jgi:2-polyprenyl-3-methyl-5-hydroxy-6-metoxy-1,4-benzoquinol methylase
VFDRREFRQHPVVNRLCQVCGLVYQSPRMTAAELESFYTEEYRQLYQGQAGPDPKDLAVQQQRAEVLLDFFQRRGARQDHPVLRHLDIGSSAGFLLQKFQEEYHCRSTGVEPGQAYQEFARQSGLEIFASIADLPAMFEVCTAQAERYDLVSMAHVLEHLPDPIGYLATVRQKLLTPHGWLLIEVPNLYAHDCFEVAHLTSFSIPILLQILGKAGFTVHAWQQHGQPRSRLIPLYLTVLAQPQDEPAERIIQPEHWVAAKRRIGMLQRKLVTRLFPRQAWVAVKK